MSKEAPRGTYQFLKQLDLKEAPTTVFFNRPDSLWTVAAAVSEETVCEKTGGSCMDLNLAFKDGKGLRIFNAHITYNDEVVRSLARFFPDDANREYIDEPTPDLPHMLTTLKELIPSNHNVDKDT